MGARYLTDLVTVLEAAGLDVVEVEGWQTRARGSGGFDGDRPWCVMWHHTASNTSAENDVAYIVNGSPDAPIANLYLARNGEVWVCAAGATNTNGKGQALAFSKGTVPADSMNTHALGVEAANSGTGQEWPQVQIDAYFRLNIAVCNAYGMAVTDCASHHQYAADRKIDPATANAVQGPWRPGALNSSGTWNDDDIRGEAWLRSIVVAPPTEPPQGDEIVEVVEIKIIEANARFLGYRVRQQSREFILWCEWVNGNDPNQLWRYETYLGMGIPVHEMAVADLKGVGLIGPVPSGDGRRDWSRDDFGNVM